MYVSFPDELIMDTKQPFVPLSDWISFNVDMHLKQTSFDSKLSSLCFSSFLMTLAFVDADWFNFSEGI